MRETDIAWAAGFFDGEGNVGLFKTSQNAIQLRTCVVQVDPRPLVKLAEMFGGKINGPYANGKSCRPIFKWTRYTAQAEAFLRAILPYLIVKRDVALVAIAARDIRSVQGKKHDAETASKLEGFRSRIKDLNARDCVLDLRQQDELEV